MHKRQDDDFRLFLNRNVLQVNGENVSSCCFMNVYMDYYKILYKQLIKILDSKKKTTWSKNNIASKYDVFKKHMGLFEIESKMHHMVYYNNKVYFYKSREDMYILNDSSKINMITKYFEIKDENKLKTFFNKSCLLGILNRYRN